MNHNVGGIDRAVRVLVGLAIIGLGVAYQSWWGALGLVPLVVAAVGWCPPYALLGISTCRTEAASSSCSCGSCACGGASQGSGA